MLYDNHGRIINYIRIAVTDRCNLRCYYCMPEEGIQFLAKKELLSYEELERLLNILAPMGISKVRITGGEPFVRKGMIDFMETVAKVEGIDSLHLTTNGTFPEKIVPRLKAIVKGINLSIDSLDSERFAEITRRDCFEQVQDRMHQLLDAGVPLKLNTVVLNNQNTEDIIPMIQLTEKLPVAVRFIEEMPFNGQGKREELVWNHKVIFDHIKSQFPDIQKLQDPQFSTSFNYQIKGYAGSFGIIPAYTRNFCGTCNRIRLTATGVIKTCLYDDGVFNIKSFMRNGATDEQLRDAFLELLANRFKDGHEAERNRRFDRPISESMTTIGG